MKTGNNHRHNICLSRMGITFKRIFMSILALSLAFNIYATNTPNQFSDDVIRIAVVTDVEGSWSESVGQGALVAAEMALDDIGGKVGDYAVEIQLIDHKHKKGEEASALAKRLIDDGFDVITELSGSSTAIPIYKYANRKKIVTIVVGAGSSSLTNKNCSKTGFHWSFDTYALSKGLTKAIASNKDGGKWYFIGLDGFVQPSAADAKPFIESNGGKILGIKGFPWKSGKTNFKPEIEKAKNMGATVIAIANAGSESVAAVRQIHESGLFVEEGSIVSLLTLLQDIRQLGLYSSRGLQFVSPFYWNYDNVTKEFSKRFLARHGSAPSSAQAAMYSSVFHYLRSVKRSGTDDGIKVARMMKSLPIDKNDPFARNAYVRTDGRMVHDMYLVEVKSPEETTEAWDYLKLIDIIPGEDAFRPLEESECPFISN
ncbi:MAG: ABC transporter substrate-binding protein [Gammaproteobacteria bacterium]|nr:MAG: ABC transporter substrate-binding protein [Gammaproteobacteria bacterium]